MLGEGMAVEEEVTDAQPVTQPIRRRAFGRGERAGLRPTGKGSGTSTREGIWRAFGPQGRGEPSALREWERAFGPRGTARGKRAL